ncbi:MAG: CoA transferase [Oleispira sp.]|nr:CoA transferase [Oleispira sp.]MBL4880037.1 CoA transferase [Oleispira sp.]
MSLPLAGLKVLDFTTLLPGPYATQLLADMGAEVLRIESPTRPDLVKLMPPFVGEGPNKVSAAHATLNRNKQSMAIDLKKEGAQEIIHKLLPEYDIVIEQFRPGVMQRLGLDFDTLKEIQPKLIYCSITGYGQTGPLKDRAGHDINYLALSGLASFSGREDTGPVLSGTQIADIAGGSHHAAMAIMAAVIQRTATGEGQYLDISMSDAAMALTTMFGSNAMTSNEDPDYGQEMLNGGLLYDYYQTSDQRYISIGSLEPNFALALLTLLELDEWKNKLADQGHEMQQKLKAAINEKVQAHSLEYWQAAFAKVDACVEPVLTMNEAFKHPHFIARGMITQAIDANDNQLKQINSALPFKRQEPHRAGKKLGADTLSIMQTLGYSDEQIAQLKKGQCL